MTRYAWSRSGGLSVGAGGCSPSSPWWVRSSATAPLLLFPPRYTASASVLLPGTWEERELLTQAEIATSSVVVDRAAATLGWTGVSGSELRDQVSAKAADGNIIKISGTADTPERAQRLSDQVAQQFVSFAARIASDNADPEAAAELEALRQSVVETSRRITELADAADPGETVESVQTRTELEKLRTALQEAITKLEQADPAATRPNMVVMGPAARPTGEAPPTRTQLIVAGALLFFLLAVIGHLTAARMSRRLRTEPEIAAALGSTLLGTVDVPVERPTRRRKAVARGPGSAGCWASTSGGTSRPRSCPATRPSRQIRYRRVCSAPAGPAAVPAAAAGRLPRRRRDRPPGRRAARRPGRERSAAARGGRPGVPADGAGPRQRVGRPGRAQRRQLDRRGARRHLRGVCGRQARGRRHRPRRSGPCDAVGRPPSAHRRTRAASFAANGTTRQESQGDDEYDRGVVDRRSAAGSADPGGGGAPAAPPVVLPRAAGAARRRGGGVPAAAAADRGDQGAGRASRRTSRTTPER